MHPLRRLLDDAATGTFPPVDGAVEVIPTDRPGHLAIVEFTGHSVILVEQDADVDRIRDEVLALGADGFGGASHPEVKLHLAGDHGSVESLDAVLVARGGGESPESVGLRERSDQDDHPRVVRSRRHRRNVRVLGDDTGLVTLGNGVVGRVEVAVEVLSDHGSGSGRRLIDAAVRVAPVGPVWAQVSPGNAASLRAFLACGFTPIGAETLVVTH